MVPCLCTAAHNHNVSAACLLLLQVAAEEGLCQLNQQTMSLADILRSHLQQPQVRYIPSPCIWSFQHVAARCKLQTSAGRGPISAIWYLQSALHTAPRPSTDQFSCRAQHHRGHPRVARHATFMPVFAQALFSDAVDADRAARDLQRIMKKRQLAPQEPLFTAGSPSEV